jgi:hypothetical protein
MVQRFTVQRLKRQSRVQGKDTRVHGSRLKNQGSATGSGEKKVTKVAKIKSKGSGPDR